MPVPATRAPQYTAILTRPAGQSAAAVERLREAGFGALDFPLIDIQGLEEPAALATLDKALRNVRQFSLVFFVSPNAIEQAFSRALAIGVPLAAMLRDAGPILAVVGPGSVLALRAYGVTPDTHRVLAPEGAFATVHADAAASLKRYDSEALLLALDKHIGRENLRGGSALVVRGEGGRELFAEALRDAGATVQALSAYQRHVPKPSDAAWAAIEALADLARTAEVADDRVFCWVLSSSEGVRNLKHLVDQRFGARDDETSRSRHKALFAAPVFVPHPRIAAAARSAGFDTITNAGAGDENLVRAILAASERNGKHPA